MRGVPYSAILAMQVWQAVEVGGRVSGNESPAGAPYRRIVDDLRRMIETGELGEGDRLPSQPRLARDYGVTRVTVTKAIAALAAEGLISTRIGSGAYVRSFQRILRSSPRRLAATWWSTGHAVQDADTGGRPRSVGAEVATGPAPDDIATAMGLAPQAQVVRRSRRFVVDEDRTVQLATSWYPADIAGGTAIEQLDTGPGGSPARLAEAGHAPARHRERILVRMPSPDEREILQLMPGTPVAQIIRLSYDAGGRCVEATTMVLDGSAYELEYVFES
jgi:GntR family transcriptional regulator